MGYMGVDKIGFFINCLIKKGWNYVYKIVLSYFEKRMEVIQTDDMFITINSKELIL